MSISLLVKTTYVEKQKNKQEREYREEETQTPPSNFNDSKNLALSSK